MRKGLIVNPEFILVTMLHDTERVFADTKVIIERALVGVIFEQNGSILSNLLLAGHHTGVQLDCVVVLIQIELPNEELLG